MAGQLLHLALLALCSLAVYNSAAQVTPDKLSPQVRTVYEKIMAGMQKEPNNTPTPKELILTSGKLRNQLAQYGDTKDFVDKIFFEELASAQEEVLMTTMIFDKNNKPTPVGVRDAIIELNKRAEKRGKKVRFWLAYDPMGTTFFEGSWQLPVHKVMVTRTMKDRPQTLNLPKPSDLKWVDFKVLKFHQGVLGTLHSKMMLIDGKTSIVGSKNMDGDISMELMVTMDGQLTRSLRADFESVWGAKLPELTTPAPDYDSTKDVPVLVVSRPQNDHSWENDFNVPQDLAWLGGVEVAEKSVYIQTPNFCDKNIADGVIKAITANKNLVVTVVTAFRQQDANQRKFSNSYGSNGDTMNAMYQQLQALGPAFASRLKWCWYIGKRVAKGSPPNEKEWSHIKFMQVDDKFVMLGSGNQDPQSWYHSRENNILIDNPETAIKLKNLVLEPQQSLDYCYSGAPGEVRAI